MVVFVAAGFSLRRTGETPMPPRKNGRKIFDWSQLGISASPPFFASFSPKNEKGRGSKPLPFYSPRAAPALYFCLCHQFAFTENQKPKTAFNPIRFT